MICLEEAVALLHSCADDFLGYGDDEYALGIRAAAQLLCETADIKKYPAEGSSVGKRKRRRQNEHTGQKRGKRARRC